MRPGITVYGIEPGQTLRAHCADLRPAMSLVSRVSFVKRIRAGERISYSLSHTFERDTTVATVPIGYADGVPRGLANERGLVLVRGKRRDIVGVVTMDQLMVDCGNDDVRVGDDAVLIGAQGPHRITVTDWADRLGTIDYEVTCGISSRVERRRS